MRARSIHRRKRRGTTAVEAAFVLPVFIVFLWGILEIGHGVMINNMLRGGCRNAARFGSAEDVTTSDVDARLRQYMESSLNTDALAVSVKDASVFDTNGPYPETAEEWDDLADIEVDDADSRQLFVVRATVPFNDIAFIPLPFTRGITLGSHSMMRHE